MEYLMLTGKTKKSCSTVKFCFKEDIKLSLSGLNLTEEELEEKRDIGLSRDSHERGTFIVTHVFTI